MIVKFLLSLLISFGITWLATPLVINYFKKKKWVEDPKEKQKKTGNATATTRVPRGGGISIFFGILIAGLWMLPLDKYLLSIIGTALAVLAVGVWDDIKDISPILRLGTNIILATVVVFLGIKINYVSNPFGGIIDLTTIKMLPEILTVFWIVWCMNIVGWAAGVEGQLPGFVSISAVFIGILGLRFASDITVWPVIILAGAVAGAYLGFLPFNFWPQKIMPGYSGKSMAGFLLAILSILSGAKLATLIFLLGIPMLDAGIVLIRRIIKRKSPFKSDSNHLHHQLLKIGWTKKQVAVFYWAVSLVLGIIALFLNSQQKFYVFLGLIILFLGFLLKVYRRI